MVPSFVLFPVIVSVFPPVAVIVVTAEILALFANWIILQVAATSTIGFPLLIITLAFAPGIPPLQFEAFDQRLSPPLLLKYFWPNAVVDTNKKVSINNRFFII